MTGEGGGLGQATGAQWGRERCGAWAVEQGGEQGGGRVSPWVTCPVVGTSPSLQLFQPKQGHHCRVCCWGRLGDPWWPWTALGFVASPIKRTLSAPWPPSHPNRVLVRDKRGQASPVSVWGGFLEEKLCTGSRARRGPCVPRNASVGCAGGGGCPNPRRETVPFWLSSWKPPLQDPRPGLPVLEGGGGVGRPRWPRLHSGSVPALPPPDLGIRGHSQGTGTSC